MMGSADEANYTQRSRVQSGE